MSAFAFEGLHFLRPLWLWGLLALPAIAWLWTRRLRRDDAWRASVDAHLLPHLLEPASNLRTRGSLAVVLLACTLALLALAGPAWKQIPQPSWQSRTPLVIAVDLSSATAAADLPPSRLLQARAKIGTLLHERDGGQVGLIAFADDAYTVAPLTDDAANVALFLDSLAPDVMPVDGHRPDRAIRRSVALLQQAGFDHGDIVVLTDHGDAAANAAAQEAARKGMRVSVLGLGGTQPVKVQAADGSVSSVSLDVASLRSLASAGDGAFAPIAMDDGDLRTLGILNARGAEAVSTQGRAGRSWKDEGYWLLPPLMLLALFAFRRGSGVAVLCLAMLMPVSFARAQDAQAPQGTLWRRADQEAARRMDTGQEAYRAGAFAQAAKHYDGLPGADAHYNLGNALAKQGRYDEAIAAYDAALRAQPGMPDALANKRAVEAAKKRKPPQGKNSKNNDPRAQGQQGGKSTSDSQDGDLSPQQAQQQRGQGSPTSAQSQSQDKPAQGQQQQQQGQGSQSKPEAPKPGAAQSQQAADAAQRERMQKALAAQQAKQGGQDKKAGQAQKQNETPEERERRLANEAWMRRVPDDPGGLLRAKFRLEYERRQMEGQD
ncbi:VWA domain-containing protein [Lysobacter sp. KIS68-7]|uniref:VWA domain-containing protein n=1 Tax=Lysobacter sp. KIS68-7 TaxID=2904252 RepID=UPI001E53D159|nr:VWA domain-containing protein [Lysobacter sp. KIS68-7]UHQ20873.1 VWA domain-containing protein [Lysobacter sp. KIS68-7]